MDSAVCSTHGKSRTTSNLEPDGAGGMKCMEGHECNGKGSAKGTPKPGDWTCPVCQDLQFARNTQCRQCGAPKPSELGYAGDSGGWSGGGGAGGAGGLSSFQQLQELVRQRAAAQGCGGNILMPMTSNMMSGGGGGGRSMMSNTMGGVSEGWIQPDGTSYGSNQPPEESFVCALHGKSRTASNLEQDGLGGWRCINGKECAGGGGQGARQPQPGDLDPRGGDSRVREGDWVCPLCGDNQFARNKECRKCGTPKGSKWGEDGSFITPRPKGADDPNAVFCSVHGKKRTANNLEDDGAGGLRCVRGHECAGGGMAFANLAAAAAEISGGGGVNGSREGDWTCPQCGWMVFARNAECKKCGTPNPNAGGQMARFSPY